MSGEKTTKGTWTMRDRVTGEVRSGEWEHADADAAEFQWLENNWSCDCNRSIEFLGYDEHERLEEELGLPKNLCVGWMPDGSQRFVLLKLACGDEPLFWGEHPEGPGYRG